MDYKPESKKDPSHKKVYVKPELKRIPLDNEEELLEFCKGKPYDAHKLKDLIKRSLRL
jgi:outer membrane translocation and assembly module TamA